MPENMEINYLGKLSKNPTKNEMALKKGHYDGRFGIEGESLCMQNEREYEINMKNF